MRVLQICLKPPLPALDGGCKAMNNITQGLLNNGVEVKVLTIATHKHPFLEDSIPEDYKSKTLIESVFIDTKIKPIDAFCNLFTKESYNVKRFYSKEFENLIVKTLKSENYDIVLLESLFVSPYIQSIRKNSSAKIIYRAHNIEFEIWEHNAKQIKGFKKNYIKLLAKRLKSFEIDLINRVDGIVPITEKDKSKLERMGCKVPLFVAPFGINMEKYQTKNTGFVKSVFHIGSMDWMPNEEGIKWFLKEVWNDVAFQDKSVSLNLAGKNMSKWLEQLNQKNVNVVGEVESANDFIDNNGIMIVPLFSGSGMRIKIIEAMAMRKLVIATKLAVTGISCEHKKNVIVANTSQEFKEALEYYLANDQERKIVEQNAKELIHSNYDNQSIVNNLVAFFQQQLN